MLIQITACIFLQKEKTWEEGRMVTNGRGGKEAGRQEWPWGLVRAANPSAETCTAEVEKEASVNTQPLPDPSKSRTSLP